MNAKTTKTVADLIALSYGQLWGFFNPNTGYPAFNPGRDDKESWGFPTTQIPMGMVDGYDLSKGSMVVIDVPTCKKVFAQLALTETDPSTKKLYDAIAADPAKVAMQQRADRATALRSAGDKTTRYLVSNPNKPSEDLALEVTNRHVADVIDSFAKVVPTHFVVCGQRRFFAAGHTLALAEKRNETIPSEYEWFATVFQTDNLTDLHGKILDENGGVNETQLYSLVGLIRNAIRLLDESPLMGTTDLGRSLGLADILSPETGRVIKSKYGTRQAVYRAASVALMLPGLNIKERIGMKETVYADSHPTKKGKLKYVKGDFIPAGKLHKEDMACFLGIRKEATDVVKLIVPDYKKGYRADEATFEKYLRIVMDGDKPRGAITPKELEEYLKHDRIANATLTFKEFATACVKGDTEFISGLGK